MSIKLKTLVVDGAGVEAKLIVIESAVSYQQFQQLVHRGLNLWPDAPAELKAFGDMVTSGKVLQNYSDDLIKARQE